VRIASTRVCVCENVQIKQLLQKNTKIATIDEVRGLEHRFNVGMKSKSTCACVCVYVCLCGHEE
jgi:hypothetical protein